MVAEWKCPQLYFSLPSPCVNSYHDFCLATSPHFERLSCRRQTINSLTSFHPTLYHLLEYGPSRREPEETGSYSSRLAHSRQKHYGVGMGCLRGRQHSFLFILCQSMLSRQKKQVRDAREKAPSCTYKSRGTELLIHSCKH